LHTTKSALSESNIVLKFLFVITEGSPYINDTFDTLDKKLSSFSLGTSGFTISSLFF